MVKVNGVDPRKQSDLCRICGAKMPRENGVPVCPNADRKDHHGQPYSGRA